MSFPPSVMRTVLASAHRCCCVCKKFCGLGANVHHIEQEAYGGANTVDNAILLCLDCHLAAGHYNPSHPLGAKYSPKELRLHRTRWLERCANPATAPARLKIECRRDDPPPVRDAMQRGQAFLREMAPLVGAINEETRNRHPRSIGQQLVDKIYGFRYASTWDLGIHHPYRFLHEEYDLRREVLWSELAALARQLIDSNYESGLDYDGSMVYQYQFGKFVLDADDEAVLADVAARMRQIVIDYDEFTCAVR